MFLCRPFVLLGSVLVAATVASGSANAADGSLYHRASGIDGYVGVVPAEITKGHEPTQPLGAMHGGVPEGGYQYHLVAAVFDAATGQRITDAAVTAQVSRLGQVGRKTPLELMSIAETLTYGGYIILAAPGLYKIALTIKRPANAEAVTLKFTYDHGSR